MTFDVFLSSSFMMLKAVPVTISLVALSLFLGAILAFILTLMQISQYKWQRFISKGYVFYFRGTPLLLQMYLLYFGIGHLIAGTDVLSIPVLGAILSEPYWYAVLALLFNTAGYTAEILRGGINAVDAGNIEAGYALGMKKFDVLRKITLPQAMRYSLPAYSNEIILMVKGSSLASTITIMEITGVMVRLRSETYAIYEFVILGGALYLALNGVITVFMQKLEQKYKIIK